MKLGFSFFGIIYGAGGRTGSGRDFRHCWPSLKRDLIDPFVAQGHEAKIFFSGYTMPEDIEKEFNELVKPDRVIYSHFANSDPFTAKYSAFNNFVGDDTLDAVIFTRSDIHFSRIMANEDIQFDKINFLFPEGDGWWEAYNFTCDNFYVIPRRYFRVVRDAMAETYKWPRPEYVDTHGLWRTLTQYVPEENFHLISKEQEISDINSFYTCCRSGLPEGDERMRHLHPEVKERFYNGSNN